MSETPDRRGQVIVVTSGKGGVGKSTVTGNLAVALSRLGHRVCAVDADIGLCNLDVVLGLTSRVVYHIVDVVGGFCRLEQAIVRDRKFDNLALLAAPPSYDKSDVSRRQWVRLGNQLADMFDFVLIDCPAGIETGFKNAIAPAEKAVVVTTPDVTAIRDADRVIGLLEASGLRNPKIIINKVRPRMQYKEEQVSLERVLDVLAVDILGIIPESEEMIAQNNFGRPVVYENSCEASQAIENIARRLLGEEVPFLNVSYTPGVWERLRGIFVL